MSRRPTLRAIIVLAPLVAAWCTCGEAARARVGGPPTEAERRLREEFERIRPRLAGADQATQERLLDEAFERAGLDPDWAEWLAWAGVLLPAHRARHG